MGIIILLTKGPFPSMQAVVLNHDLCVHIPLPCFQGSAGADRARATSSILGFRLRHFLVCIRAGLPLPTPFVVSPATAPVLVLVTAVFARMVAVYPARRPLSRVGVRVVGR